MSVTPLHYTPALPAPGGADLERIRGVIDLLPVYIELAGRIANTEFVPTALRRRPEAILAALMSGAERGLGPMESLRSIHIIEGRPTLAAEAMRALVLARGHDIDIVEATAQRASLVGRRAGSDSTSPPFTWTLDRARRARLINKDNWQRYPESMLLARASSDLCKAIFPDVIAGLEVTEVVLDETVEPIPTTSRRAPQRRLTAPLPVPGPEAPPPVREIEVLDTVSDQAARGEVAHPVPGEAGSTSTTDDIPGADQPTWGTPAPTAPDPAPHDPNLARRIHAEVTKAFPDTPAETRDRWRHALVAVVTRRRPDGPAPSSSDLNHEEQLALSELLVRIIAGQASVADGPDETVELRAGGGWRYTIRLDPPAVTIRQGDPPEEGEA